MPTERVGPEALGDLYLQAIEALVQVRGLTTQPPLPGGQSLTWTAVEREASPNHARGSPMSSTAILVGVDAYRSRPLTRAVRDAKQVRDALVGLGLVDAADVHLLTSDAIDPKLLPTRRNILGVLRSVFEARDPPERMFFYFAGHGALTFADPTRNVTTTALATLDVEDFEQDGDGYISLDAVVATFRSAGPGEQHYFVDACRNLAWKRHPAVNPTIGFAQQAPGPSRGQAIVYAVSQLGEAIADKLEGSSFTEDLVDALHGRGLGVVYDAEHDRFVVTAQSVRDHVRRRAAARLAIVPLWKHKYMLPELDLRDPQPGPLRVVDAIAQVPLTVHVEPDTAAAQTTVRLGSGPAVLHGMGWPPSLNHQPVTLLPMIYSLTAESSAGPVERPRRSIDVRWESEATVRVQATAPPPAPTGPGRARSTPRIHVSPHPAAAPLIEIRAYEPTTEIVLTSCDAAHRSWTAFGALAETLPPGAYKVAFLHGREPFCQGDLVVHTGEHAHVESVLERTELFGTGSLDADSMPRMKVVSEGIGPMQAGLIETTLALIGVKPLDTLGTLAAQLNGLTDWAQLSPRAEPNRAVLSVVLALEGNGWPATPVELIRQTKCMLHSISGKTAVELRPLQGVVQHLGFDGTRVGVATASFELPGRVSVILLNDRVVRLKLLALTLRDYVTVVTILVRPDGSLELGQYAVLRPDRHPWSAEDFCLCPQIRDLHITQRLLAGACDPYTVTDLPRDVRALLEGKMYDPILSAEVLLRQPSPATPIAREIMERIIRVHGSHFSRANAYGGTPQISIERSYDEAELAGMIANGLGDGLAGWERQNMRDFIVPVLASGARLIARSVEDPEETAAGRALRQAVPGSLWMYTRDPGPNRDNADEEQVSR